MPPRLLSRVVGLGLLVASLAAAPAAAAPVVDGEFSIPGDLGSNNKLVEGPDGNMWLTVGGANDVAKITPAGDVTEYDLEATNASGITSGPLGRLWVTRDGGVTSFLPSDPPNSKDPHGIGLITGFHSIVVGPDGNLWVATKDNLIKVPPEDPTNETPFAVAGLDPRDIDVAGSNLVIADGNTAEGRIVIATTSGTTTDVPLGGENPGSQGVAGHPSGQIAYTQAQADPREIGLLTPPAAALKTQFPGEDPFGIALGPDGAFWAAESLGPRLIRITTDNQVSFLGGFASGYFARQISAGPGNTLWVTMEKFEDGKVARVSGVDPPAAVPIAAPPARPVRPNTRIVRGPKKRVRTKRRRARVAFRFRASPKGARFQCALQNLKKRKRGKAAPKPRFRRCKSPKRYRLGPGKYRFWVRAVLNGAADPTPAKRTFRIVRIKRR